MKVTVSWEKMYYKIERVKVDGNVKKLRELFCRDRLLYGVTDWVQELAPSFARA